MSFLDGILTVVYLGICFGIGSQIRNRNSHNPLYRKWFMKGLAAKLFGGIAFALVYTYYYDYGGDSRSYFEDSELVVSSMTKGVFVYWEVLNHQFQGVSSEALDIVRRMSFQQPREYLVVNIVSVFTILGLGSYFSTSLLVALFTYWGVWKFFLLLVKKFPRIERQMAFSILFVPSVFFWGSGISKDSFILCSVGLVLYHIDLIFSGKFWRMQSFIIILLSAYVMYIVKPYVLISLAPAIALWRTIYLRDQIKSKTLRNLALPVVSAASVVAIVFTLDFVSQYNSAYSMDSFVDTAQDMQGWHYKEGHNTSEEDGRGSSYTLGEYDESSWFGLLKVFPAAVNVTFFRPYLWEAQGVTMLAQAVESLIFLIFTVLTILKVGPIRTYQYISNDSFLLMCVVFAVFFGFAVGFSSYNFGALSRYKIPCIPFFVASLFILRHKYQESKQARFMRIQRRRQQRTVPGFTS